MSERSVTQNLTYEGEEAVSSGEEIDLSVGQVIQYFDFSNMPDLVDYEIIGRYTKDGVQGNHSAANPSPWVEEVLVLKNIKTEEVAHVGVEAFKHNMGIEGAFK